MRDRQLDDAQAGARRPHLHFEVPAVGLFAHAEPHQRIAPDRAERAHIGVADAVEQPHRRADDPAGKQLMRGHAARLPLAAGARADHEIVSAVGDRRDEARDQLRAVAAVAVEKHDDVAILARPRPRPGRPGRSRARAGSTTRAPAARAALDRAVGAASCRRR